MVYNFSFCTGISDIQARRLPPGEASRARYALAGRNGAVYVWSDPRPHGREGVQGTDAAGGVRRVSRRVQRPQSHP